MMRIQIGEDTKRQRLERHEASTALAALASACRRSLWLRLPLLDALTSDTAVCEAIQSLAVRSARVDIRVLVDDASQAIAEGHRLVHLARRLPSRMQIRQADEEDRDEQCCFALADGTGMLEAPGWPAPERVILCAHAVDTAPREKQRFLSQWERSTTNPALRELRL